MLRPRRPTRPHLSPLPSHKGLQFLGPILRLVLLPSLLVPTLAVRNLVDPYSRRLSHGATVLLTRATFRVLLLLPRAPLRGLPSLFRAPHQALILVSPAPRVDTSIATPIVALSTSSAASSTAPDSSLNPDDFSCWTMSASSWTSRTNFWHPNAVPSGVSCLDLTSSSG
jgi:hypothetical protein